VSSVRFGGEIRERSAGRKSSLVLQKESPRDGSSVPQIHFVVTKPNPIHSRARADRNLLLDSLTRKMHCENRREEKGGAFLMAGKAETNHGHEQNLVEIVRGLSFIEIHF
jgi:hypothetical protein